MIPEIEATKQIEEFKKALEDFKQTEGSDLSYLNLLKTNPILEGYFKNLIGKDIFNSEYGLVKLLVSKDQMIPKIDDKSTLRCLIEAYGGSQVDDIINKLIAKSDSIENDKDKENNNLIASLLEGEDNQDTEDIPTYVKQIIKALAEKGVSVDDKNNSGQTSLDLCWNLEILKTLAEFASPKTLEKKLYYILETILETDEIENNRDALKFLLTEKKVKIDGFLDCNFSCTALKNNFTELVCKDDKIKESFLAQLSSSSSQQIDKFFEGLSEENISLILEAQNESGETFLLNLLRKHIPYPSDENKEKIKYIFKKQFKRDLRDEEIPDLVEFTKTYNFFNLFYDKDGQYMYDQSFKSALLFYLPKEEDLQDDLSKQLLKIYQQIAKRKVADITCKDDDGGKETHLYSYHAKLKSHSSYFIFHVNDENKLTKISYCDGHGISGHEANAMDEYIHGATTFLLKEPQDFNDAFAQEFIKKNSEGEKISDFQGEFSEKIKGGKIFDYEFSTITQSIPTKIQTRSNCALKSANILARFFLEQQNQHRKPHQSSLFILDPAQGEVIGEGHKAYKDLKESMSQKVDEKLIEDVKKVPDDFVKHIELFEKTNNKWKQVRVKKQKINEFYEALQSFDEDPNKLRYRELLEEDHSLFDYLKKVVAKYIEDNEYEKINLLLENSKISDPIFEFESERQDMYEECFHGNILTHSVIACSDKSLALIGKHISKFKLGKDSEGDNLLSLLMQGADNQEDLDDALILCIKISEILINHGVSVDDKNNDGKTPLDFCYAPELFKILANHANQETLEKNLRCNIENEDWVNIDWDKRMFKKDSGWVFTNIKFLLTEKKVKIDGFLDWNFSCSTLKNYFTEFVCKDNEIKDSFLAQLSSSSSEQRDKFFEGLSEENISLIKEKLQEQLIKQQELELIVGELKEHVKKDDKYGFKQWYRNPSLCFSQEIMNKNAEFLKAVINGSDDKKNSFMEAHCSVSPEQRLEFLSGLKPEYINFILEKAEKRLDSLKKHNEILEKLKHLTNPQEGAQSSSDGPKVGSKRQREDGDEETRGIKDGGEETRGIEVTSCKTAVNHNTRVARW